jgi:hypothetical protein
MHHGMEQHGLQKQTEIINQQWMLIMVITINGEIIDDFQQILQHDKHDL